MSDMAKIRHVYAGKYMAVNTNRMFGNEEIRAVSIVWVDAAWATLMPRDRAHDMAKTYIALTGDHGVEIEEA